MATLNYIKDLLKTIGFILEDGKVNIWKKIYKNHSNYKISVDIDNETIDFGNLITLGDKTTSNFKAAENFVVLECVNRLLEKGYKPEYITLEKDYPLGHKTKGKLDILVTDTDGKAFLMIECKTYGKEYEQACKKTVTDGGQIFSYFQQDKSAQYLCLYASKFENENIKYENAIIRVEEHFLQATNAKEAFEKWNKNSKNNGIFEDWATPYKPKCKAITIGELQHLTRDHSNKIFNQFAEILRHNVVSDKPNAFNKLITLLLCKIVDEEKGEHEEAEFQWFDDDTDINLQKRLNDLYKKGMDTYLSKEVTDFSDKYVEDKFFNLSDIQKQEIKNIITDLRLKKNNEFAFKEVFNSDSFEENSIVLKEVVELFQEYKLRYNKKQQFLGDFFELLLNTSIKQEAGQFFTPVPIARFIINSIPVRHIIHTKASKGEQDFLPYIIDYACGSGHFLTEAMDEINNAILELNQENTFRPDIKKKLKIWSEDASFDWAYDFVYGIEKDYRLVKTAKVSCFLNGDGLAQIFNADGLANFQLNTDYKGKLKSISRDDARDNQQFEVLIANPPYSVSSFRNTLVNGDKSFELYNRLTENSSEIECLFVERTKQLMKDGGYVGIILPSSILNNNGIYEDAREILLKHFRIVAIVEFGSNTFMATGTNTVTLFLEKRNSADWQKIQHVVKTFFSNYVDVACNGIENPFGKYVSSVYQTISIADYVSLVNRQPNQAIKEHDIYKDYSNWFNNLTTTKNLKTSKTFKDKTPDQQQAELDKLFFDTVLPIEQEKLFYFILAYPQKVVVVKANPDGKNETEKSFLGYEFSNRRGHEGIKPYGGNTIQEATKLYNESQPLDPTKVNTYIHNAFLNNIGEIDQSLKDHVFVQDLADLMTFNRVEFTKTVSLAVKKKQFNYSQFWGVPSERLKPLHEIAILKKGTSITISDVSEGEFPVIAGGKTPAYSHNKSNFDGNVITVSASGANAGYLWYHSYPIFASDCSVIQSKDEDVLPTKLLYELLQLLQPQIYELQKGQAQPHVYISDLNNILIPVVENKQEIIEEIEIIENKEKKAREEIEKSKESILTLFSKLELKANKTIKLSDSNIFHVSIGQRVLKNEFVKNGEIPVYSANVMEPFGNIDKLLIQDFSKASVLWGIDGDWMVNYLPKEYPFYPTDHCGVLRVKDNSIHEKYLAYILEKEGKAFEFSRTKRASIDRIQGIKIPVPPRPEQEKIIIEIEKIEQNISELKKQIESISKEKSMILNKYLA
jgi:type I restriction enzyme M protein